MASATAILSVTLAILYVSGENPCCASWRVGHADSGPEARLFRCPNMRLPLDWELRRFQQGLAAMLIYTGLWLLLAVYVAGVVGPRVFWVAAGRRCPECPSGRLWFAGLAENPWRRLRSCWRCETCQAEVREVSWGRLEATANLAANAGNPAEVEADLAA